MDNNIAVRIMLILTDEVGEQMIMRALLTVFRPSPSQ
jgi:hypothetical protein